LPRTPDNENNVGGSNNTEIEERISLTAKTMMSSVKELENSMKNKIIEL